MTKTYLEMIELPTFEERFNYLKCKGVPSEQTFGGHRSLNQILYKSPQWLKVRQQVIIRDAGCDLADPDRPINSRIVIHHINPLTINQVMNHDPEVFDLNNLVCVTHSTHEAIHYGSLERLTPNDPIVRSKGDTKLW